MSYEDMRDFQMREEQGEDYTPPPLSFTADELAERFPNGMDEDDVAAMNHAMDKDMAQRMRKAESDAEYWRNEYYRLAAQVNQAALTEGS